MAKKVLAISTSFRKGGNSDRLMDAWIQGAEENGNTIEKIYLSNNKIENCRGCLACQKIGHCVIKDDMTEILTKMQDADVVVFATPVYFYGMCGAMKTFLDRTFPLYPDKQHFQEVYLMVTAEDDAEDTVQGTQAALGRLANMQGNGAKCVVMAVYGNREFEDTLVQMQDAAAQQGFQVIAAAALMLKKNCSERKENQLFL